MTYRVLEDGAQADASQDLEADELPERRVGVCGEQQPEPYCCDDRADEHEWPDLACFLEAFRCVSREKKEGGD